MHVTALRQVVLVAVTGSGLLFGGASISRNLDKHPSLLYAAGELRMMLGDRQGGVELIGRAEAAREALNKDNQAPAKNQAKPAAKPVEVCTKQRTSSEQRPIVNETDSDVVAAAFPPAPPSLPASVVPPGFDSVAFANFDSLGRRWQQVSIRHIHIADQARAAHRAEHMRAVYESQRQVHGNNVRVAAILRGVREDLKRQGIPMSRDAIVALEPPAMDQ